MNDKYGHITSHQTATFRHLPSHIRTFQTYVGPRMYLVFVLGLIAALSESIGIVMLLPLLQSLGDFDFGTESGIGRIVGEILNWLGIAESTVLLLVVIGGFFALKGVLIFITHAYEAYLASNLLRELKTRMFDDFTRMRLEYFVARDTGHFMNVLNSQLDGFVGTFRSFVKFGLSVVTTLIYLTLALAVAWRFGVMTAVLGVVLLMAFQKLNYYVRQLSHKVALESGHLTKLLIQSLQALKYLAATGQASKVRHGVVRSVDQLASYSIRQGVAQAFTQSVREPITVVAILTIVIVQLLWLKEPLGPILIAIILFKRGLDAVLATQQAWQQTMSTVGSLEMVRSEFSRQAFEREPDGTHEIGPLTASIELIDVTFAYEGQRSAVFKSISLMIQARTTVAIVGESGAGKSTLADLLTMVHRPTKGKIKIDGVPSEWARLASWRKQIGFVSQETVVFDETIANNICLWEGDVETDPRLFERVKEAARQANLAETIEGLPDGYGTYVGDRGVRLSGGQRQRLFIARELFRKPNLLILDEATSALDSESEMAIRKSIDALKGQITVVVIAHRLATIRNADQIFVLEKGEIRESGNYRELRDNPKSRFAQLVAAQKL